MRKLGNRVRIAVQLIKIEDGYHLWSNRYDRVLEDVFEMRDEVTLSIVEALKVRLLGEEKQQLLKHATTNPEAYTLYLKSRFHWNRRTQQDLEQAIDFSQ